MWKKVTRSIGAVLGLFALTTIGFAGRATAPYVQGELLIAFKDPSGHFAGMEKTAHGQAAGLAELRIAGLLGESGEKLLRKAGVSGFTLSLAKELARYRIRVNAVVPGLLDDGVGKMVPEKEKVEYMKHCTAGRPGRTEEVAEAVAFLASEKAGYVNAQNVFVDGGL